MVVVVYGNILILLLPVVLPAATLLLRLDSPWSKGVAEHLPGR